MSPEVDEPVSPVFRPSPQTCSLDEPRAGARNEATLKMVALCTRYLVNHSGIPSRVDDWIGAQLAWPVKEQGTSKVFVEHSQILIPADGHVEVHVTGPFGHGLQFRSEISGDRIEADIIGVVAARQDDGGQCGKDQGRTLHLVDAPLLGLPVGGG